MRIIEIIAPCRCAECKGARKLQQVILNAETSEDIKTLEAITAKIQSDAEAKGAQITEREINVNYQAIGEEKQRKAAVARNN